MNIMNETPLDTGSISAEGKVEPHESSANFEAVKAAAEAEAATSDDPETKKSTAKKTSGKKKPK